MNDTDISLEEILEDLERVERGEPSQIMPVAASVAGKEREEELQLRWKMACDALYDLYFEGRDDKKLVRVERILFE